MGSLPAPEATRAALYCRVSTDRQERDGTSLDTQEEKGRAHIASKGYRLDDAHVYREAASGYTLERPKLKALLDAVRRGEIDVVVVYEVGRLSRSQHNTHIILARLKANGVAIEFVTSTFENNAVGTFMLSAEAFVAEYWREQHIERTANGLIARAKSGKLQPNGKPAYGYKWRDPTPAVEGMKAHTAYDLDPAKAGTVRRVFETVAAGGSLVGLRDAFEAEGMVSPSGLPHWSTSTLKTWIRNPLYKGEPVLWRTQTVRHDGGTRSMHQRPEADHIKLPAGVVPPIVSPELWQRANDQLDRNRAQSARRNKHASDYLLRAGFVVCPHCGRNMGTLANKTLRYRTSPAYERDHGCPQASIDAATLDREVWALVEGIVKQPERIVDHITQSFSMDDPTKVDREDITARLKEVKQAQAMQTLAIEALGDMETAAPNIVRLRQLSQERQQLEADLAALDRRREGWASGLAAAERLLEMFYAEQARLDDLSYEEKRALMGWLGVKVKLYPQGVEPRWTLTTSIALPGAQEIEPTPSDLIDEPVPGGVYASGKVFGDDETYPAMAETIAIASNAGSRPSSRRESSTSPGSTSRTSVG
jgi:site-specific DNA recombinase